jgi:hypothetical protein
MQQMRLPSRVATGPLQTMQPACRPTEKVDRFQCFSKRVKRGEAPERVWYSLHY